MVFYKLTCELPAVPRSPGSLSVPFIILVRAQILVATFVLHVSLEVLIVCLPLSYVVVSVLPSHLAFTFLTILMELAFVVTTIVVFVSAVSCCKSVDPLALLDSSSSPVHSWTMSFAVEIFSCETGRFKISPCGIWPFLFSQSLKLVVTKTASVNAPFLAFIESERSLSFKLALLKVSIVVNDCITSYLGPIFAEFPGSCVPLAVGIVFIFGHFDLVGANRTFAIELVIYPVALVPNLFRVDVNSLTRLQASVPAAFIARSIKLEASLTMWLELAIYGCTTTSVEASLNLEIADLRSTLHFLYL